MTRKEIKGVLTATKQTGRMNESEVSQWSRAVCVCVCVCVFVCTCSKARTAPPSMPVSHFCRCLFFFKRGEEARNSHHLCSAWLRAFPSDRLSLCFYLSVFFSMLHSNRCCHFVIGLLLRHARWKGNHPCLISF